MRLLHISDTHNLHRALHNLPAADIIVHSGDISMAGTGKEVNDFVEWFAKLDYAHKIFIAGNTYGCADLLLAVLKIAPRYHLFGHIHAAYGIEKWGTTTFVNAALVNEHYEMDRKAFVFDL